MGFLFIGAGRNCSTVVVETLEVLDVFPALATDHLDEVLVEGGVPTGAMAIPSSSRIGIIALQSLRDLIFKITWFQSGPIGQHGGRNKSALRDP